MEPSFWHERWQKNAIGFHQDAINSQLLQFWPKLAPTARAEIFVPLCGKSRDMLWLRERGHSVLGVELSPIAVRDFFTENSLTATRSNVGAFEIWEADRLKILVGDFFHLVANQLSKTSYVYDRASLIALPPALRENYAIHLTKILPNGADILLVTLEYPQNQMQGPPFSVKENEVHTLFNEHYRITQLQAKDVLAENDHLRQRGLNALSECAYHLQPLKDRITL